MPNVVIIVEVAGQAPGVPGQSRLFQYSVLAPTPPLVTVKLNDDTGVTSYFWEFLDRPKDSVAVFSDPTASEPTFTPDATLTSTYLMQCTVNDGESRGRIAVAFGTEKLDARKLAAGEGPEYDALKGWVEAYNDFVDKVDDLLLTQGNVTGPDPSTLRGIATYANETGTELYDNLLRIADKIDGTNFPVRSLQAYDSSLSATWRDLISLEDITPGVEAGGVEVIVGNAHTKASLQAIDDPKARGAGGVGKIIHEAVNTPWAVGKQGGISLPTEPNTQRIFYLGTGGSNGAQVDMYCGEVDPQGAVTAPPGSVYFRGSSALANASIYVHRGVAATNSDWAEIGFSGGGNVTGPDPSTMRGIPTFGNTAGTSLLDNNVRIETAIGGPGGSMTQRAIQAMGPSGPAIWYDLIQLANIVPGAEAGGIEAILGSQYSKTSVMAIDDPKARGAGGVGKILHEAINSTWELGKEGGISLPTEPNTTRVFYLHTGGTNGGQADFYAGATDPTGVVTAIPGSIYVQAAAAASTLWQHKGAVSNNTGWVEFKTDYLTANYLATKGVNDIGADMVPLDVVYVTASPTGIPNFKLGVAGNYTTSRIIGLSTTTTPDGVEAEVFCYGPMTDQNTIAWPDNTELYLDQDNNGKLTAVPPTGGNYTIRICKVLRSHASEGVLFVDPHISEYPRELNFYTGWPTDPLGFLSYEYDKTSRTLTIRRVGQNWNLYQVGEKCSAGTEDPLNPGEYIDEFVVSDVQGLHLIYYDDCIMTEVVNPIPGDLSLLMRTNPYVCFLRLDDTAINRRCTYLGPEPHQFTINPINHALWHFNVGATYQGGMSLSDFSIGAGAVDADAQFGVDQGILSDEDLVMSRGPAISTVGLPIGYLEGANFDWRRDDQNGFSVKPSAGTRLAYNDLTGGSATQVEVGNGNFVLCHVFATNDFWDSLAETATGHGYLSLQGTNEYSTLNDAQEGANSEIHTLLSFTPAQERFPVATVIYQSSIGYGNTIKARVVQTDEPANYVNWLTTEFGQAPPPTSHLALTDKDGGTEGDGGHTNMVVKGGRAGGQTLQGGTGVNEDLTLESTANATKGSVHLKDGRRFDRLTVVGSSHTTSIGEYALDFSYSLTGPVAVTLADVNAIDGQELVLSDISDNASNNEITATPESGTIMGEPNLIINGDGDSVTVYHNGTEWRLK